MNAHGDVKTTCCRFCLPCYVIVEQKRFSAVFYCSYFLAVSINEKKKKRNGFFYYFFCYQGWNSSISNRVKEQLFFVFNVIEPIDCIASAVPQIDISFL